MPQVLLRTVVLSPTAGRSSNHWNLQKKMGKAQEIGFSFRFVMIYLYVLKESKMTMYNLIGAAKDNVNTQKLSESREY